ncbi:MAG: peptidase S8, partial [Gemmatimonadaceae bacterium]
VALLASYAQEKRATRVSDAQLKHVLKNSADRVDEMFKHPKAGFGRLNILDAVKLLEYRLSTRHAKAA